MKILTALHKISNNVSLPFETKLNELLNLGCQALKMEIGIVSEIAGTRYTIVAAVTPDNSIADGAEYALGETFCKDTLESDGIVAYYDAAKTCSLNHPAVKAYQLHAYIGIPLVVDGERFGVVGFSSGKPREREFSSEECDYILLLAEWVGTEISRKRYLDNILAQKAELKRQNQMLNQMAELAEVGTWELYPHTKEVVWSDSLKRLFERPDAVDLSIEGSLAIIPNAEERQRLRQLLETCIASGESFSMEMEIVTGAGKTIWTATMGQAIYKDDVCIKVVGASQNITARKEAHRELENKRRVAEQALQSRSLFLANMSHEIRTPINGVLGMLDALQQTRLDEHQSELCAIASQSASSLLGLINDILDFSKIDSGQLVLESVPLSVSDIVIQQCRIFQHTAASKGIELKSDTRATDDLTFIGDPTRIRQILTNLINNAIKFTDQGEVNIHTRALQQSPSHYLINLIVKDTGTGIDPARQTIIFSPFQQGDSATTRQYGGTGLGLSIVAQIAEMMHGGIRVASEKGRGATFVVALRLQTCDSAETVVPDEQSDLGLCKIALRGRYILVVEDNAINRRVILEQLKELGITADFAQNGGEAVEKMIRGMTGSEPYDLVLMDCQMPVMDGYEAAAAIRQLGGDALKIPIVALTANAMTGEREKCALAGMNDYLTKPINVDRLSRCLTRYLIADMRSPELEI